MRVNLHSLGAYYMPGALDTSTDVIQINPLKQLLAYSQRIESQRLYFTTVGKSSVTRIYNRILRLLKFIQRWGQLAFPAKYTEELGS